MERALAALERYVKDIQKLPDEEGSNVNHQFYRDLCFFLLYKFEQLLNTYESVFGYPRLMEFNKHDRFEDYVTLFNSLVKNSSSNS